MIVRPLPRLGLLASALLAVQALASPALAVPKAKPTAPAAASGPETAEQKAVKELAKSIVAHLPPPPATQSACNSDARAAVKAAVEATLLTANATPSMAVSAIELARAQPQKLDPCRDGALADSATESSGNGEVVDEADAVRGFTLYEGPWPPPKVQPVALTEPAPEVEEAAPTPKPAAVKAKRHKAVRHRSPTPTT